MRRTRTRVSPGSAASRLARWRWHRNPGGLTLSKKLGGRLLEWHGGQSSALYRIGSRAYGGHPIQSPGDIDDALWELNRAYEGHISASAKRHLDATIAMLERESGHQNKNNPVCIGTCYRLHDGDVVTAAQLRRMFMGKMPGPKHRRLLGITKVKRNPMGGRRLARARCRILSRATVAARINKASGGARNAVMRSILAQVMAGRVKIRGARISAAVKGGIRRGRR
jgi:hypothetical protein